MGQRDESAAEPAPSPSRPAPDHEPAHQPGAVDADIKALRAENDLLRRRLAETARAAQRALYHMRGQHHRLLSGCDYCGFEFSQLERVLARVEV